MQLIYKPTAAGFQRIVHIIKGGKRTGYDVAADIDASPAGGKHDKCGGQLMRWAMPDMIGRWLMCHKCCATVTPT